ncbi:MAG: response regulator transcription factor [bacterium]|nr:response regulator transcription factor [bacterium]
MTGQARQILLVEDDAKLGQQVVDQLRAAGFGVDWIRDGDTARDRLPGEAHLVVLDLMLPGTYGLDLLKELRRSSDVPVLVLSAQEDTHVKVRALELGADDYLTKPFWPEELLARVHARLRRPLAAPDGQLVLGELAIDTAARRVLARGEAIELTRVEFDVLATLARRPGAAVSRIDLAADVLDPEREGTERTLDVHVSRLRKKLGPLGSYVTTVWGVGYRLEERAP